MIKDLVENIIFLTRMLQLLNKESSPLTIYINYYYNEVAHVNNSLVVAKLL